MQKANGSSTQGKPSLRSVTPTTTATAPVMAIEVPWEWEGEISQPNFLAQDTVLLRGGRRGTEALVADVLIAALSAGQRVCLGIVGRFEAGLRASVRAKLGMVENHLGLEPRISTDAWLGRCGGCVIRGPWEEILVRVRNMRDTDIALVCGLPALHTANPAAPGQAVIDAIGELTSLPFTLIASTTDLFPVGNDDAHDVGTIVVDYLTSPLAYQHALILQSRRLEDGRCWYDPWRLPPLLAGRFKRVDDGNRSPLVQALRGRSETGNV